MPVDRTDTVDGRGCQKMTVEVNTEQLPAASVPTEGIRDVH